MVKLCTLGGFRFRGDLGVLNCNDICICAVNKQFVLYSVYVDLQYDEISRILLLGMFACVVFVVMWSSLVCPCGCLRTIC